MQFEAVKNFVGKHFQAAVVGAAATLGLTGCGSALPKQEQQNFGRQNLGALTAPQLPPAAASPAAQASKDIKNLKTDQLLAKVDQEMRIGNPVYTDAVLNQPRPWPRRASTIQVHRCLFLSSLLMLVTSLMIGEARRGLENAWSGR